MSASAWEFDDGQPANEATASHGDWTFDDGKPAVTEAPPETAGRVAGLTARALTEGGAGLAGTIAESATTALNPALAVPLVGRHVADWMLEKLTGVKPASPPLPSPTDLPAVAAQAGTSASDAVGLPTPVTSGERIYSAAVGALPSAALSPEAPIAGAISAGLGGAASQTVAENGGGPVAQTVAGLGAGLTPAGTGALVRGVTRGGAAGQAAMEARMADAAAAGTQLDASQASGSRLLQAIRNTSGRLWGGGAVSKAAAQQTQDLGASVDNIVANLNQSGAVLTPTGAGEAIEKGVASAKTSMKQDEAAAYGKVDALVPADHPVDVSGTQAVLDKLATPTPGATNTTGALVSPKIAALRDNLAADAQANGGTIPYSAARAARTALGNSIDWGFSPADPVTNGALKQVYGALGEDVNGAASAISPEARQAVDDARTLYAGNQAKRQLLDSVVGKAGGPEKVYAAATNGTKQGATTIGGVMSALDPENQNVVRATVLQRLGQAIPSAADSTGGFDASTFLTRWNQLAPEAKDALFGKSGQAGSLRNSLDAITRTMSTLRDAGHTLANPSGSAGAGAHAFELWKLLEVAGGVGTDVLAGDGHHLAAGAAVLSAIPANMVLSRALVNPRTARWLASNSKLPAAARVQAVNQLARMGEATGDPDAQDLAAYLRQQGVGR